MPSNSDFKLEILVADTPVPEYTKNGEHFVECNLSTPVSYMHQQSDVINGETEVQSWPVTPYRIRIKASPMTDTEYPKYFRVLVDGVKVKGISLDPGEWKVIKGFRDGPSIREFLFSMPRYAKDTNDRIETYRCKAVGKIVVECWDAVLRRSKWSLRSKYLDFKQANKKDSSQVTDGKYTMATSCPGKVVSGRAIHRLVDSWKLQKLRSTITVSYHMGHTLREMGFTLRSLEISPDNVRLAQRLRDTNTERQSVSDNKEVKREPMDIPERSKPKNPEVIDLTEEQNTVRSQQESAMDLSMRSANSDRAASDAHSDDGYNSDNLCIVEDGGTPSRVSSRPTRAEKESRTDNKESESTVVNNEPQTDAKESVANDEEIEMVEVGEHDTDREGTEHCPDKEKETEKNDSAMDVVEVPDTENDNVVTDALNKSDVEEKAEDGSKTAENENCNNEEGESKTVDEIEVIDENENRSAEKECLEVECDDEDSMMDVAVERIETEEKETEEVEQKDEESSAVVVETEAQNEMTAAENESDVIEEERTDKDNVPQESGDTIPEEGDKNVEKNDTVSTANLENTNFTESKQNDSDGARVEDAEQLKTGAENEDFVVLDTVEGDEFLTDEEKDSTNGKNGKTDKTKEDSCLEEAADSVERA